MYTQTQSTARFSVRKIASTFAGCFIGAGYVSGQELWQFFGCFGRSGFLGFFLAFCLLAFFSTALFDIVLHTGAAEMDRALVPWRGMGALRRLSAGVQLLFLFGVAAIMYAGGGAMLEQLFGIPAFVGSAVMAVFVTLVALHGLSGTVETFSLLVPLMVVMTVIFSVTALMRYGFTAPTAVVPEVGNPLLQSWSVGFLSFSFYNFFCSVGVLAPLAGSAGDAYRLRRGVLLGGTMLLPIAFGVLLSLTAYPQAAEAELPMLALAYSLSRPFGYLYGVLLLLAMFSTAISTTVAVTEYACKKSMRIAEKRRGFVLALALLAFAASLGGFGDLISVIYPIFGYCSSIFVASMLLFRFSMKKHGKSGTNASRASSTETAE